MRTSISKPPKGATHYLSDGLCRVYYHLQPNRLSVWLRNDWQVSAMTITEAYTRLTPIHFRS
ncbi:hypothetical protein GCM10007895_06120 [Paraferrimonas sedimenticola]|uniref:Uncharacterized protein n=1 Tax=Paraferrimonas sedimenticola TaxID=375674 RepID=A0AA37VTI9_9GAMM|nr:hypothetical protein GCM10007895_06120 [Paraferrimonas sedimenticola]